MKDMFETVHLKIRKFHIDDARYLYENHLEDEVKRWIPNESYADIDEAKNAVNFYLTCVNNGHLPYVLAVELKETLKAMTEFTAEKFSVKVLYGRVMRGNDAYIRVLEKNGYAFLREEIGAEDDPYGNGILVYKKEC